MFRFADQVRMGGWMVPRRAPDRPCRVQQSESERLDPLQGPRVHGRFSFQGTAFEGQGPVRSTFIIIVIIIINYYYNNNQ